MIGDFVPASPVEHYDGAIHSESRTPFINSVLTKG